MKNPFHLRRNGCITRRLRENSASWLPLLPIIPVFSPVQTGGAQESKPSQGGTPCGAIIRTTRCHPVLDRDSPGKALPALSGPVADSNHLNALTLLAGSLQVGEYAPLLAFSPTSGAMEGLGKRPVRPVTATGLDGVIDHHRNGVGIHAVMERIDALGETGDAPVAGVKVPPVLRRVNWIFPHPVWEAIGLNARSRLLREQLAGDFLRKIFFNLFHYFAFPAPCEAMPGNSAPGANVQCLAGTPVEGRSLVRLRPVRGGGFAPRLIRAITWGVVGVDVQRPGLHITIVRGVLVDVCATMD